MNKVSVPYENKNIDPGQYLDEILEYHRKNTPYWSQRLTKTKVNSLIAADLDTTMQALMALEVPQHVLRTNWLDFKPRRLANLKCSFSSGTTGPQKYCLWSEDYCTQHSLYHKYYLSKWGIKIRNAVIQGPSSVYKDINEKLVNRFGGTPYFVGLRVEGIKPALDEAATKGPEEILKVVRDYFEIEIEKTRRFLDHDSNINCIRSAWMMLAPFEVFFGDKRNIDTVIVSGLGYTPQNHEMLKSKFKTVVHSYGYFAFGDALGVEKDGNLDYYPSFPYAMSTVVKENGELAAYGEQGHPAFIVARRDLFLVLKEDKEWAVRVPSVKGFNWDGIRNPYRSV
jgi:hypothetical protein